MALGFHEMKTADLRSLIRLLRSSKAYKLMRRDTLLAPSLQLLRKGLKKALNAMETLHVKIKKKSSWTC